MTIKMRIKFFMLLLLSLTFLPSHSQKFTILHTNDLHSRLLGFAPTSDYSPDVTGNDATKGGFARIAGYFDQVERENGQKPLILDAGDFLMGTLFHTLEPQEGFQLRLMKEMGYDVVAIGNHEFDMGIETLGSIIQNASQKGKIPVLVQSNIEFNPKEPEDDRLQSLFQQEIIRSSYVMNYGDLKIGFFGLMGDEAALVAPFVRPAHFTDRITAAKEFSSYLKEKEKVDLVICLSHCGVAKDKKGRWTGEDFDLAKEAEDIDLIIGGHSHTHLFEPLIVNGTPIVQTGSEGQFVGRLDLEWKNGKLQIINYGLRLMDDQIQGKASIQKSIMDYQQKITETIFSGFSFDPQKPLVETAYDLRFSEQGDMPGSNLGPFLVDAIHWYVKESMPNDITMLAAGLIRDEIRTGSRGYQLPNDIFRVLPLGSGVYDHSPGYSLAQVYLTAKEIKNVLEAMLLAPKISTGNFPYWAGVKFQYNPRRILLDQVYEISLGSEAEGYELLDLSKNNKKLYRLTTNNYVLEFFGLVSEVTHGLLKVAPKNEFGEEVTDLNSLLLDGDPKTPGLQEMKEWAAVLAYVGSFEDLNQNGVPDFPDYYRSPHQAGTRNPSLNPVDLWGNGNGIMAGFSLVLLALLSGTGLLFLL